MPLKPRLRSLRDLVLLAATAALAACATPTPAPPPSVVKPAPAPEVSPPPPPVAPPPQQQQQPEAMPVAEVPRAIAAAVELLEAGDSAQAETELRRVLATEPNNRLALSLMRQIREDPLAQFGRESSPYRVQPGESLSSIARRFLGDVYLFYGLARYNGIKVPRALAGGQMIRVPRRDGVVVPLQTQPAAVPQPPAPAPPPPVAMPVPVPAPQPAAPLPGPSEAQKKAAEIARLTKAARAAFARQDLDGALRNWDAVLKLEPDNVNAKSEGQKARQLKDKLSGVK